MRSDILESDRRCREVQIRVIRQRESGSKRNNPAESDPFVGTTEGSRQSAEPREPALPCSGTGYQGLED